MSLIFKHLGVKRVKTQLVFTLELLGVDLLKGDPVGRSVEDVHLREEEDNFQISNDDSED